MGWFERKGYQAGWQGSLLDHGWIRSVGEIGLVCYRSVGVGCCIKSRVQSLGDNDVAQYALRIYLLWATLSLTSESGCHSSRSNVMSHQVWSLERDADKGVRYTVKLWPTGPHKRAGMRYRMLRGEWHKSGVGFNE